MKKTTTYAGSSRSSILGSSRQHGLGQQPGERAHVEALLGKANAAGSARPFMTEATRDALDRAALDRTRPSPIRGSRLSFDGRSPIEG